MHVDDTEASSIDASIYAITEDTVNLIIWHAAETSVTMVCIGIPVCRPALRSWMERVSTSKDKSNSNDPAYRKRSDEAVFALNSIGGTPFRQKDKSGGSSVANHRMAVPGDVHSQLRECDITIAASARPTTSTSTVRAASFDGSDDSILGPDIDSSRERNVGRSGGSGEEESSRRDSRRIWVKKEFRVKSSDAWQ